MFTDSKKSEANQKESQANDYAQRLSLQNNSYTCVVKTSTGFGVIEKHPFDVRYTGWNVVRVYDCGAISIH